MSTVTASMRTRIIAAASAVAIALGLGVTSAGAAQAADTGSISGTITLPADAPAEWMGTVEVSATTAGFATRAKPDAQGNYTIEGLPPGVYRVKANVYPLDDEDSNQFPNSPLLDEYYGDSVYWESAAAIPVSADEALSGIDIALDYGHSISGTVTLDEGSDPSLLTQPIAVSATNTADGLTYRYQLIDPETGGYTIRGLIPGKYVLQFEGWTFGTADPTNVLTEYYKDADHRADAEEVDVTGSDATGITVSLAEGRTISGTVTMAPGVPQEWLRGVRVLALDEQGRTVQDTTVNIEDGTYVLNRLTADQVAVKFEPAWYEDPSTGWSGTAGFTAEYYNDMTEHQVADLVRLTEGSVTGIDAELSVYGPFGRFFDVTSHVESLNYSQFHREIEWLANRGISTGFHVGNGAYEFRAKDSISREAMAAFLYRHAGSPEVTLPARSPFTDVEPGSQFYKEIVWLSQEGISTGWNMGGGKAEFRAKEPIARDAMAAFLYRYAGKPAFTPPSRSPFTDTTPAGTQFYKEVTWLADTGVSTGWRMGGGKAEYRPYNNITREAMAAFLYRYDRLDS